MSSTRSVGSASDRDERVQGHDQCDAATFELRHRVLTMTDRALGAEAERDRLQATVTALCAEVERAKTTVRKANTERDAARKEVAAIRASQTWRVGYLIVAPAARLARLRAKRP